MFELSTHKLIDKIQYKTNQRSDYSYASYSLVKQINSKIVYSFYVSGGVIAPCATKTMKLLQMDGPSPKKLSTAALV